MINANGNASELNKVAESVPVNIPGIDILVLVMLAKSTSRQVILDYLCGM